MNTPAVSVIVPVYNKERGLSRCLDSLLSQTLDDIEVICIDDCSGDDSGTVLERYASADHRIKAIRHDRNQGVGAARNTGLSHARGTYVTFVDADDTLRPTALETACEKGSAADADVVVYDLTFCQGGVCDDDAGPTSLFMSYLPPEHDDPFTCAAAGTRAFLFTGASACTKLFRRQLLESLGLRFTDHRIAEDLLFTYTALASAKKITAVEEALYQYDLGTGSGNEVDSDNINVLTDVFTVLRDRLNEKDLLGLYRDALVNLAFGHFDNMFHAAPDAASLKQAFDAVSAWVRAEDNAMLREGDIEFAHENYETAFRLARTDDFASYLAFRYDDALRMLSAERTSANDLLCQLEALQAQAASARTEAEALRASASYKVGNLLVRLPSKAKRALGNKSEGRNR